MSPTMKNIVVPLLAVTLTYAAYVFFIQGDTVVDDGATLTDEVLLRTQVFIERRALLDTVAIDVALFEDPVFRSYRSFATPVEDEPFGRSNPFGRTGIPQSTFAQ